VRKHQRLKEMSPARDHKDGQVVEGLIKDLSLSGSSIPGKARVSIDERLSLQLFVLGDSEPLTIDRASGDSDHERSPHGRYVKTPMSEV
jgi:hypothetical protein